MKIDISGNFERQSLIEYEGKISELEISGDDFPFEDKVRIVGKIFRDGDITHVVATVYGVADVECSRCLKSYKQDVSEDFEIVVRRLKLGEKPPEILSEDEDDTDNIIFVSHDQTNVDITSFVRDALLLSVPYKTLCSDECKGLCSSCGSDLNDGPCECSPVTGDPRWEKLAGILNQKNNN